jgi:uncharacterized protein (DUF433 family)
MAATNILNPEFEKLRGWVAEAIRLYFEPLRWILAPFLRDASRAAGSSSVARERRTLGHEQGNERELVAEPLRAEIRWEPDVLDRIVIEGRVGSGKPIIRGTRITVHDVVQYLAGGMTAEEILEDFPQLSPDDIRAAVSYAAEHEQTH